MELTIKEKRMALLWAGKVVMIFVAAAAFLHVLAMLFIKTNPQLRLDPVNVHGFVLISSFFLALSCVPSARFRNAVIIFSTPVSGILSGITAPYAISMLSSMPVMNYNGDTILMGHMIFMLIPAFIFYNGSSERQAEHAGEVNLENGRT